MNKNSKIYIAGHTGMVGSNVLDKLKASGYNNLITASHKELDLLNTSQVVNYFRTNQLDYCFLCAAKVGGILSSNNYQADFIYQNTMIQTNIIKCCHDFHVKKLMFLGSSCCYPKNAIIPIKEDSLSCGPLEETNVGYSTAKINGIMMCQMFNKQYDDNFISVMPCNLYGKNDRYHLNNGHVFPTLIMKIHNALINNLPFIELWGTGGTMREFLFAEDLVDAMITLMNNYDDPEIINIGTGEDISILDLVKKMCQIIGYKGQIVFDNSKPDGVYRKVLDISKISKYWQPSTSLEEGIRKAYNAYVAFIERRA
jgi:GDP-L-fucose synthase